jgi:HAE1 family hydrophobic/amphiphilic exporter-1
MTTLAMVFGMVPLAFALTEGSEQRAPMGQAVIGGVITSSLLTLVVVPVVYCWLDDLAVLIRPDRPCICLHGEIAMNLPLNTSANIS